MMKKWFFLGFAALMTFFMQSFAGDPTAKEIVRKADEKAKGTTSQGEMKMTIIRPKWTREITLRNWTKGDKYALLLIASPAREKGTAFLKRGNEIWNWQPTIDRTVKMPPSMMAQSWMGSDFSNDDLVKQSSVVDDFEHKLLGSEVIEGRNCYKIQMLPKENTPVVWGKIITWIDKQEFMQMKGEFYDEDGYLIHTLLGKNVTNLGGKMLPATLEVIPADEPKNRTIIQQLWIKFDEPIPDDFFSVQNMKRLNP